MCNLVSNPRFADSNLSLWQQTGNPVYVPNDGNDQLGCVELVASGDAVEQFVLLTESLTYTVSVAVKGDGAQVALSLVNQDGDTAYSNTITGTAAWAETAVAVNLPASQYTIRLAWASGTVRLDDISLAHIPASRVELARLADRNLGELATTFSLSYGPDGDDTEGDYTQAVTSALREVGAIDERNLPDVRCLKPYEVDEAVDRIVYHMMPILHNRAMLKPTSSTTGPVTDKFNLLGAIEKRMGIVPGQANINPAGVVTRRLTYD
ncbi:MAG TPA: hypothetical protein EYH05_04045 [Anaerolineae bacterium]|nr:hypothetical protein [Anaerolineae bacterium]